MSATPIRIAIVDDHPMIRRGVRLTFGDEADFEIVGEGASYAEAIALAGSARPDLILLDVSMPGGGLEAAERLAKSHPETKIAIMTIYDDLATVRRALQAGVAGFLSKGIDGAELVACVRRIARGERYISPDLAMRLLQIAPAASEPIQPQPNVANVMLTKREQDLLALLGEGLSNAEIAARTGLADTTVKQYVSMLLQKLGVRNRTAAALLARTAAAEPGA